MCGLSEHIAVLMQLSEYYHVCKRSSSTWRRQIKLKPAAGTWALIQKESDAIWWIWLPTHLMKWYDGMHTFVSQEDRGDLKGWDCVRMVFVSTKWDNGLYLGKQRTFIQAWKKATRLGWFGTYIIGLYVKMSALKITIPYPWKKNSVVI